MPKHRTRRAVTPLFLLIILILAVGWTQLRPLPAPLAVVSLKVPTAASKKLSLPWPSYGQAALGTTSYGVIASSGQQKPVPTASLAKVITALAVLRQYPLQSDDSGPMITIRQADIDSYNSYVARDGSVVQVSLGEQISQRQALEALLLPSANNMADTLARWAFGSIKDYTSYANSYVRSLGLQDVTVTDPSGLSASTVASASDMVKLGQIAMLNPTFASIVAEPTATIPVQGAIQNYNALLGSDNNIGIKTGNNDEDKGAYLFANKITVGSQTITLVGAIMDGPDLLTVLRDARSLSRAAAQEFSQTTFVKAGQTVATYTLPDNRKVLAAANQDLSILTWNGASNTVSSTVQPLTLPSPTGSKVGEVVLNTTISTSKTSVPVTITSAAVKPSWQWRLTHPF